MTGNHPSFGAVVSPLRGTSSEVPPFVICAASRAAPSPASSAWLIGPSRPAVPRRKICGRLGVTTNQIDQRRSLLAGFDEARREVDATGTMAGMDTFTQRAST